MVEEDKKKFLFNAIYLIFLILLIFLFFKFLFIYLLPFILAFLFAYSVNKTTNKLVRKSKIKRKYCVILVSCLMLFVLASVLALFFFILFYGFKFIFNNFEEIISSLNKAFMLLKSNTEDFLFKISPEISQKFDFELLRFSDSFSSRITVFLTDFTGNLLKKIPSFLFSFFITLIAAFYTVKDYEKLLKFLRLILGKERFFKIKKIKDIIENNIFKIMGGYLILMTITFSELLVFFIILRFKSPFILSFLISFVDLLPVLGVGTVLIPWGAVLIISGNIKGFFIILSYLFITFVRNFSEPKIIGGKIGINPFFTLFSMFLGFKIFGLWGIFFAPAALICLFKYYEPEAS